MSNKPSPSEAHLSRFLNLLRNYPNGISGRELAVALFGNDTESTKRRVRSLAEISRPYCVSAPDVGYKHLDRCTDEDLIACEKSMQAQANKMNEAARVIRQARDGRRDRQTSLALSA